MAWWIWLLISVLGVLAVGGVTLAIVLLVQLSHMFDGFG